MEKKALSQCASAAVSIVLSQGAPPVQASCTGTHLWILCSVLGAGTKDKGKEHHQLPSAKIVTNSEEVIVGGA